MGDIEDQFSELKRIEKREQRKQDSPVSSWRDEREVRDYLAELRRREREAILPKDRRCERCGCVHLNPRSWVVLVNGRSDQRWRTKLHLWQKRRSLEIERTGIVPARNFPFSAICRSCYAMRPSGSAERFMEPVVFWLVDSRKLKLMRYKKGLTGSQVSKKCGWSQAKQSKIESQSMILHEEGVRSLNDCLGVDLRMGDPVRRYRLDGPALQRARSACGVSRKALADHLEVSISRVRHLETRESLIEERIAKTLVHVLGGIDSTLLDE